MAKYQYRRRVILNKNGVEAVLITWPAGSESFFHDHGKSHGVVRVLKGKIKEEVYAKKDKKFLKESVFKKGETCIETPDIIHKMSNPFKTEAVSMHLYAPNLKMKTYKI